MKIILLSRDITTFKNKYEKYISLKKKKFDKTDFTIEFNFFKKIDDETIKKLKLYDFIIFDSDTIEESFFKTLIKHKFNNIIFLSQYLNWDKIIEVFKNENIYYLKPLKFEDFNL